MAPLVIERTFFLPYLPFSLLQNARSNPHRLLSLLGDKSNRIHGLNCRHVETEAYQDYTQTFVSAYRHSTRTDLLEERRCIERWFVLSDFLRKTKIETFYFLDSDYLLFCDLSDWEDCWQGNDVC